MTTVALFTLTLAVLVGWKKAPESLVILAAGAVGLVAANLAG